MSEHTPYGRKSWCSWCGEYSSHTLFKKSLVRRNIYRCASCEFFTVQCRHCNNMARAAQGRYHDKNNKGASEASEGAAEASSSQVSRFFTDNWDNELCAEHDGTMPDFSKAHMKIAELGDFKTLMEPKQKNLYSFGKNAGLVAGGVAAVGTGAFMAAPGIAAALGSYGALGAASTGTAISTLNGAALTSASLAKLGVGGLSIVTAAGAGLGGKTGYGLANAYLKEIPDYDFSMQRSSAQDDGHRVVVVNGFLTQEEVAAHDWCNGLTCHYLESPIWYLNWEAKTLRKLGEMVIGTGSRSIARGLLTKGVTKGSKTAASRAGIAGVALSAAGLASNPWHSAMMNAEKAGSLLAEAISRTEGKTFTLMGHSLGARVVFFALMALASKGGEKYVRDAVLMGGAVGIDNEDDWISASIAVSGNLYNCHSEQDGVLKWLYRTANAGLSNPAGLGPAKHQVPKLINQDFTDLVDGHNQWKANLSNVLDRLQLGKVHQDVNH